MLYKTARADTVLGMHKLLPFDLYETPPLDASKHLVKLVHGKEVIENISLQEIYDEHIRPGQILYLKEGPKKKDANRKDSLQDEQVQTQFRTYGILEAESLTGNTKDPAKGKGLGVLRVTPINLSSPVAYLQHALDRSYQFIKSGAPVEFTLAIAKKSEPDKKKRLAAADASLWHWMHEHFPHLRPDFILKSMPEGSRFVVDPVSDGKVIQFVIAAAPPAELRLGYSPKWKDSIPNNLTKRLMSVKKSVQKSINEGKQAQLPKVYREMLEESGNKAYSKHSHVPTTAQARERDALSELEVPYEEPEPHKRYMPVAPQEALPPRVDKLDKGGNLKGPVPSRVYERRKKKPLLAAAMSPGWEKRGNVHSKA